MTLTRTEDLKTKKGAIADLDEQRALLSQFHAHSPVLCEMLYDLIDPQPIEQWEGKVDAMQSWLEVNGHAENPHDYEHTFTDGIYFRKMKKGAYELGIGARHRLKHLCILHSGAQIVFTNEGIFPMVGPVDFIGEKGSRKVTLTLTPVVFSNVFPNPENLTDIERLEDELTMKEEKELAI